MVVGVGDVFRVVRCDSVKSWRPLALVWCIAVGAVALVGYDRFLRTRPLAAASGIARTRPPRLAQTPLKDQGETPFCWAYAAVALLEQQHLATTGRELDLSEDYLAAVSYVEQLRRGLPLSGGQEVFGALDLVDRYGLVPEKDFSPRLRRDPTDEISRAASARPHSEDEARVIVARVFGASLPPRTVATDFARTTLSFRREAWHTVALPNPDENRPAFSAVLRRVHDALRAGRAVAIGFQNLKNMRYDYETGIWCEPCGASAVTGGHAGLIVEAEPGPDGRIPAAAYILRDSYGYGGLNLVYDGFPSLGGLPSFLRMTDSYLVALARSSRPPAASFDFELGYRNDRALHSGGTEASFSYLVFPDIAAPLHPRPQKSGPDVFVSVDPRLKSMTIPLRSSSSDAATEDRYPVRKAIGISFRSGMQSVCIGVEPPPGVRRIAGFLSPFWDFPYFVLDEGNGFEQCRRLPEGMRLLTLQAYDEWGGALGQHSYPIR